MTGQQVVRRLQAFQKGRPLPIGETLRVRVAPNRDILIVAFVRMGGESAPWGIAYGHPGTKPTILTVPEPRNRDMVADMVARFAPVFLEHLSHPSHGGPRVDDGRQLRLRQVWLPNPSHLEMFQNLAYSYSRTTFGSPERAALLNQFGRAAGWLFSEAHRPGQAVAMVATDALTTSYVFPAEDVRQGHLGFLLAWLETTGSRDARTARAREEEQSSVSTSLNPGDERKSLEGPLERFNQARTPPGDEKAQGHWKDVIAEALRPHLARRFDLTASAIASLRSDGRRENAFLDRFVKATLNEQWGQFLKIERRVEDGDGARVFIPSPETDRDPAAAASCYLIHEASQDMLDSLLVHDDKELQAELIAEGRAIRGTISDVSDEGEGKKTVPIWIVESDADAPMRLREGSDVCVVGCRTREGCIRDMELTKERRFRFTIQITKCVTVPKSDPKTLPATSPMLKGRTVVLVPPSKEGIARSKSIKVWKRDVPGAHLTHPRVSSARADLAVSDLVILRISGPKSMDATVSQSSATPTQFRPRDRPPVRHGVATQGRIGRRRPRPHPGHAEGAPAQRGASGRASRRHRPRTQAEPRLLANAARDRPNRELIKRNGARRCPGQ